MRDSQPCSIQPIIIIGAGRSGTKFLRDLLAASHEVAAIPFDVNYVWRYGNESAESDVFSANSLTEESRQFIRSTLLRLARLGSKPEAKVVIEKTVSNCLRVEYVNAVVPEARYLHLIRDGRAVAESARRVWTRPPSRGYLWRKLQYFPWRNYRYALWYVGNLIQSRRRGRVWGPRYPGMHVDLSAMDLLEVCARQWRECVVSAERDLQMMPRDKVLQLRYEQLVMDESVLDRICEFCGISDRRFLKEKYRSVVEVTNVTKWQSQLSRSEISRLNASLGDVLQAVGYTV